MSNSETGTISLQQITILNRPYMEVSTETFLVYNQSESVDSFLFAREGSWHQAHKNTSCRE